MANWAELPWEILWLIISEKLADVSDLYRLSCVCKSWRSLALEYRKRYLPRNVPGLMIPGINGDTSCKTRRFLAFSSGKNISHELQLPKLSVPHINTCRGSFEGWLVMINGLSIYLFNPFSGTCIDLPPVTSLPKPLGNLKIREWSIEKATLSANPSLSSDFFVMIYYPPQMAFCKLGDDTWRRVHCPNTYLRDAIYYKGQFHVVNNDGYVFVCNLTAGQLKLTKIDAQPKETCVNVHMEKQYLVESDGELLQIFRIYRECESEESGCESDEEDDGDYDHDNNEAEEEQEVDHGNCEDDDYNFYDNFNYDDNNYHDDDHYFPNTRYKTTHFEVFKLDTTGSDPEWLKVNNLDGKAIFLGLNQSFSLSELRLSGFQENCIYFTDCDGGPLSGNDVGIFHLEDSTIDPIYLPDAQSIPPAIWLTPMP